MALHRSQHTLCFPVDFLDVVVHFDRQQLTAFGPAILQDLATTACLHPLAESMDANTATFLGLIGTFWHSRTSFKKRAQGAISHQTMLLVTRDTTTIGAITQTNWQIAAV
jgi:hypothetical protein